MRRPLIGGEDFETSIGQGEQAQGKVMEVYQGRGKSLGGWEKEKGRERMCEKRRRISSYGGKVLFMKKICARIKHGRISMTKPLEFYFK
jgi:hypothetical protein